MMTYAQDRCQTGSEKDCDPRHYHYPYMDGMLDMRHLVQQ
jgi:hypothetical protein